MALCSALVMETHLLPSDGVDSMFELNKKGRRESFCRWVFGGLGDGVAVAVRRAAG